MTLTDAEREWGKHQVEEYAALYQRYQIYAKILQEILGYAAKKLAPMGMVQSRPKSVASFAEKIWRKRSEAPDPVHDLTDLCGGRVITSTQDEVLAISEFIESHFEIDWENSVDVTQRLKPSEFGYRSVHYIVQFKPGVFPSDEIPITVPEEVLELKAEIQVRTILEHLWADFNHRMVYKKGYRLPMVWERKLAKLAALLEESDSLLMDIRDGLDLYLKSFGAYLKKDEISREIDTLTQVLVYDTDNVELADQIARMAISIGEWQVATDILIPLEKSRHPLVIRDLGIAFIHLYNPGDPEYRKGQEYLEEAARLMNDDPDVLTSLASSWIPIDEETAQVTFQKAFEQDPFNAYALSYHLAYQIAEYHDLSLIAVMRPTMNAAIQRCHEFAAVGVGLPWAYYDAAFLLLLLGRDHEALTSLAKALQLSPDDWMIRKSLSLLRKIKRVRSNLPGYEWLLRLHLLGLAVFFPDTEAFESIKELAGEPYAIEEPIFILAGGCGKNIQNLMEKYENLLVAAFTEYKGTIISGGTIAGISGISGTIQEKYPDTVTTIGYIPSCINFDTVVDRRVRECRTTEGSGFSPLEALQYWIDSIASGIRPEQVKIIGINGGPISAAEYRIALALGAKVGIVQESGREASKLLVDEEWNSSQNLIVLPKDPATIRAFVREGITSFNPAIRETIAQKIHEEYLTSQMGEVQKNTPNLKEWENLSDEFKDSNRLQADDIMVKLKEIGYSMRKGDSREIKSVIFTPEEVEILAELEHGRWNAERLLKGWKWGKIKNVEKRISPYLVSWNVLPDEIKDWDRATVKKIPEFLANSGYELYRE